jgi:hypothetical protein
MHPSSTVTKDKENVPPNISHTSANITKTVFVEKHDNCAPPSARLFTNFVTINVSHGQECIL